MAIYKAAVFSAAIAILLSSVMGTPLVDSKSSLNEIGNFEMVKKDIRIVKGQDQKGFFMEQHVNRPTHRVLRAPSNLFLSQIRPKFPNHIPPCATTEQTLDPANYFNTPHTFVPDSYNRVECSGRVGARGLPECVYGIMDCVTVYKDLHFIRKPSHDCSTWYDDVIPNVPSGCMCMWPN